MIRLLTALLLFVPLALFGQTRSVRQAMEEMRQSHGVFFVYDASLRLDAPYKGVSLRGKPLKEALRLLFCDTDIRYKRRGRNIMLWRETRVEAKPKAPRLQTYVVRGLVTDSIGEPIANASVIELAARQGALTNERGRYVLHLPKGGHRLAASYLGSRSVATVQLGSNTELNFVLASEKALDEVTVVADLNSSTRTTQTGKRTLTAEDLNREYALLSSPDLVKVIQQTSGVTSGAELASGLYVHGGAGDENLFLLDGTPLYQTNHSLGLFSAFNTDIIKNVDFYKSGFPARYSGRVSSITDVRTRDGDMKHVHGTFSLGLIDGRLQVEGPVVKDKTSFNIALRRSWIDLLLKPAYALINSGNDEEKYSFGYAFYDLNAKVTHRWGNGHLAWLSLYTGSDNYSIHDTSSWEGYVTDTENRLSWGNTNVTLGTDLRLGTAVSASLAAVATYSHSLHDADEDDAYRYDDGTRRRFSLDVTSNRTRMYDVGAKADCRWYPRGHRVRFGGAFTHHSFRPQTTSQSFFYGDEAEQVDTSHVAESNRTSSNELSLYVEDELDFSRHWSAGLGCSYTFVHTQGTGYHLLDPRFALKYGWNDGMAVKISFTRMSQSVHRIASTFLELPTDFWVPTTSAVRPTVSHQWAGGFYVERKAWTASLEGFFKRTSRLLQYKEWLGLLPPAARWSQNITEGDGRACGVELDAAYRTPRMRASLAYTLSWSERRFPLLHAGWFRDQFDNRHVLDLNVRYKLSGRLSLSAAWTFHSGNRITLPEGYALQPSTPGEKSGEEAGFIYSSPNNVALPAYHRLDLGADFRHTGKHGREHVWNVSVYNAYCHMNTMFVKVHKNDDGTFSARCKGYIPIIPSVSYTLKF